MPESLTSSVVREQTAEKQVPRTLASTPIRDLGLCIEGTALEPIIQRFIAELAAADIRMPQPQFYLSTEWGVPFNTISIAIPFYLTRPELTRLHAERHGHVEGADTKDILRYLRHEMGHVINYAYQLYESEEWVRLFGSITQPYEEEYVPEPFSVRFVQHLPGWYAQKHPDEDWSETFAVWLTPPMGTWRKDYADRPIALEKLEYCDRTLQRLRTLVPTVTATEFDEDIASLSGSLEQYYAGCASDTGAPFPPGLDGALSAIFTIPHQAQTDRELFRSAADLIRGLEPELMNNVYVWTGHFPERIRPLVRHLADRAAQLQHGYFASQERSVSVGITALVTALAMNAALRGTYFP